MKKPLIERLLSKVELSPDGCWNWTGCRDKRGYGLTSIKRRMIRAHQATYKIFVGPVPDGLCLDHLCFNTSCCNPWHLEPVTLAENFARATRAGRLNYPQRNLLKTHCKFGHPYDGANTIRSPAGRKCRKCSNRRSVEYQRKQAAKRRSI